MTDIVTGSGMAQHAYRTYATEQGQDPALGRVKAVETANQTASVAQSANSLAAVDDLFISPAAAELYAESLRKSRRVEKKPPNTGPGSSDSATTKLPERAIDSTQKDASAKAPFSVPQHKKKH